MRVIEPKQRNVKKNKHKKVRVGSAIATLLVLGLLTYSYVFIFKQSKIDNANSSAVLAEHKLSLRANDNPQDSDFKYFAGEDFQNLYNSIAYPNSESIRIAPPITGNSQADERIRTIAASRGYGLRSVPVASIVKTNIPGLSSDDLLQQPALQSWQAIKQAADTAGIPLNVSSAYRSIDYQRQLFLSKLQLTHVTTAQIANGAADNQIVSVLRQTSVPGFSRHHTGYTVDFVCGNGVQSFRTTTCFKWLSDNNYLNAKKAGWIPSYPDDINQQGPEPEPWEYVWVGVPALLKD